jgi:hypothetical protein
MSVPQALTPQEIREFTSDYAPNNYLIDGEEMSDTYISLCMTLAADDFNAMTPKSGFGVETFPSKSLLLYGTLAYAYDGKAVLLARNTMAYSDGGLNIPIEERAELYKNLADSFMTRFTTNSKALKIQQNMDSGWGHVSSDYGLFPTW